MHIAFMFISFVSSRTEASALSAGWRMRSGTAWYTAEVLGAVLGVVLRMMTAEVGHTSEVCIYAVRFDAFELPVIFVYVAYWIIGVI